MLQIVPGSVRKQFFWCERISSNQAGYSALELIVVVGMVAIIGSIAIANLKTLDDPLNNATAALEHYLRLSRGHAMANTFSVMVTPDSSTHLAASSNSSCSETTGWTNVQDLTLELPTGASFASTSWSACFTQRGFADAYVTFQVQDTQSRTKTIEIALAGGARVQ